MGYDDLLSVTEAARAHGASRTTIYRAVEDGRLTGVEVGERTMIVADEKWDTFEPEKRGARHPNYGASDDE